MAYTYIISCENGTLYTGIAKDIKKRLSQHANREKVSAKYTKSHKVSCLEALWETQSYANAAKLEYRIKSLSRAKKLELIANPHSVCDTFSDLSGIEFTVSDALVFPSEIRLIIGKC